MPHKPVTGVIGASFSVVSIMVANILRLFKVLYLKSIFTEIKNSLKLNGHLHVTVFIVTFIY